MSMLLDEITRAAQRLADAGVESPRADAEQIAAHIHGVPQGKLHTIRDADFDARFWADVARREAREPLQHITGRAYFRYLELEVGPGVFVPRPETEVMTGWAIEQLRAMDAAEPIVVDLGTGSGAIALAIAQEVPRAQVHAVEAERLAHAWAERNVGLFTSLGFTSLGFTSLGFTSLGFTSPGALGRTRDDPRVILHLCDLKAALPELDGIVDLVISNPPYIPEGASVPPEVGEYDPPEALWGGPDGLTTVRQVERTAARLLRPGGLVAVEHGSPQGAAVYWLFGEGQGWRDTRNHKDLASRDRFITSRREDTGDDRGAHREPGTRLWQDGPL